MENIFDCSDCLSCIKSAAAKEREDNSKRVLDDKEESKTELKRKELAKQFLVGNEFRCENPRTEGERFICRTCDFKTRARLKVKWHVLNQHGDEKNKSPRPKFFKYSPSHLKGSQYYECGECDHTSDVYSGIKRHIALEHANAEALPLYTMLRANKNQNIKKEFRCNKCKYSSKAKRTIVKHVECHNPATKHLATMQKVTGEKNKNCNDCGFAADSGDTLKIHKATVHAGHLSLSISDQGKEYIVLRANKRLDIAKRYCCTKCSYSAKTKLMMKKHIENHRGDGERTLTCKKCDFSTRQLGEHRTHRQLHFYEKRCPKCDFKTNLPEEYRNHRKDHCPGLKKFRADPLGENHLEEIINHLEEIDTSFSCTKCDFATKYEGRYKTHNEKNHTTCNVCGYISISGNDMKEHIAKEHSEHIADSATPKKGYAVQRANRKLGLAGKFKCCKCDYSSKTRLSIKKHLEKHSSDGFRVFNCSKCEFTTQELGDHRYHKREHRLQKKCLKCDFSTDEVSEYKSHRELHRKRKNLDLLPKSQNSMDESEAIVPPMVNLNTVVLKSLPPMHTEDITEDVSTSLKKINQIADALKNFKEFKSTRSPLSLEIGNKPASAQRENHKQVEKIHQDESSRGFKPSDGRKGRPRFSESQVSLLESIYQSEKFPTRELKKNASLRTGLTLAKVKSWFNNRRAKALKRGVEEKTKSGIGNNLESSPVIFLKGNGNSFDKCPAEEMKSWIKSEKKLTLAKRKNYRQRKKCPKCDFTTKLPEDYKDHKRVHRKVAIKSHSNEMTEGLKGQMTKIKRFSAEQVKILETIYAIKKYPTASMRLEASAQTKLPMGKVQGWFSQKRLKSGKTSKRRKKFLIKGEAHLKNEEKEISKLLADIDNSPNIMEGVNSDSKLVKSETIKSESISTPEKLNKTAKDGAKSKKFLKAGQVKVLKAFFQTNKYPTKSQKRDLAKKIGFPSTKVAVWFNNQRVKIRLHGDRDKVNESRSKLRKGKFEEKVEAKKEIKGCNSGECDVLVGCDECN